MELDIKGLFRILPHRYPFLMIDKIVEVEPDRRVVAVKNVTFNEPYFAGHFPGEPIMPGVLQLEMMAQAGGVMLLTVPGREGKLPLFAGVEKARFRRPVRPGDILVVEMTMVKARKLVGWIKGEARVDGNVVCEAEMSFALVDREDVP